MNLFWLLTLAHFIADFPLQSDKIYALKSKHKWGILPHIFISFITNLLVAFPFLVHRNFWIAVILLAVSHFLLDWLKILVTKELLSDSLALFLIDQLLHIFFIWLVCCYLFDIPSPHIKSNFFSDIYLNKKIIISLAGLVFSVFGGGVLIHYIRKIIHRLKTKGRDEQVHFPDFNKRRIGYIERFFSTLGTILGGWFIVIVPVGFISRLIFDNKNNSRQFVMINLISGLFISIGCGLIVRLLW